MVLQLSQQLDARSHFSEEDSLQQQTGPSTTLATPPTGQQSGTSGGVTSWDRDGGRRQHTRGELMQQE